MAAMSSDQQQSSDWQLKPEQELRFEVDVTDTAFLTVSSGTAEIFGTELALNRKYKFSGVKLAVFTWHGCQVNLTGKWTSAYVSDETPMRQYLAVHNALEAQRAAAAAQGAEGARVIVVGPTDSGKSTLCKVLLSYAARMQRRPIYADLDIGQGSTAIPGCITAVNVDRPVDVEEGFGMSVPLALFYGHARADENPPFYRHLVERLAAILERRMSVDPVVRASGLIVNTMGWVEDTGYELLRHALDTLKCSLVLVMNSDRLHASLTAAYAGSAVTVVKLPRSGGVVERSREFRRLTREARIREYFYGVTGDLSPHQKVLNFDDVQIYRIGGGPIAPVTVLPLGNKSAIDPLRVMQVPIAPELTPDDLLQANVAGFVYVTHVDLHRRQLTVMSPSPGNLPSSLLIAGSIKWLE